MAVEIAKHQWTLAAYRRMGATGILCEDDRVELIKGDVVEMTPSGSRHAAAVAWLDAWLHQAVGRAALVFVQNPLELDPRSEPQPDLMLLRPRPDYYAGALPTPAAVLLLIEVADTSLEFDRQVKAPLYAAAGIPEYWIVNLQDRVLETYQDPAPTGYRMAASLGTGAVARAATLPGLTLDIATVLGSGNNGM